MNVYLALTRPKLKRGAEWKLTAINGLLTILMVLTTLWHWWTLFAAAFFYWPGQWMLRQAAKHDPQWLAVYTRSLSHPLIREPHGFARSRERKPRPLIPKFPKWVK